MIFTVFVTVAFWLSPIPLWLKIVITVGAVFHAFESIGIDVNINKKGD